MKVILYMAITPNGMIAGENDDTGWVTEKSWESYLDTVRKGKNAIIGRRTYEIMPPSEFQKDCVYVVVSRRGTADKKSPGVVFAESPKSALALLEQKGFDRAWVYGGGKLNASFMQENLVDEIYLDIEPTVLGKGIRLFAEAGFETRLELVELKKLSENEIQLHYRVKK